MKKHSLICLITILLTLGFALAAANNAHAAIGTGGATCTARNKSTATSLTCTVATQNIEAGNIAILWFAGDNNATVNGNDGLLSSVADSAGNTWTVQRCFTNAQGGGKKGATTCLAWSKLTTALTSGSSTITANTNYNGTTTYAKAIVVKEFTVAAGNTISAVATATDLENDNQDPGSMTISGLTNTEHLFIRSTALERANASWTATGGYTSSGCNGTTGGSGATNMTVCGEFRVLTATSSTSNPSLSSEDCASIFLAFDEVTAPGTANKLGFLQQPTNTTAGATISPAVTVEIQDSSGTRVGTHNCSNCVTIAINPPPSGTLSGTLTVDAVNGVATFSNLSIAEWANGYTLVANSTQGLTSATSSAFNIRGPDHLAFVQQPSETQVGVSITPEVTVEILDSAGNRVTTATNSITLTKDPGSPAGNLSGGGAVSAVAGLATFSALSIDAPGNNFKLIASATGITSATSDAFNIISAPGGPFGSTQCIAERVTGPDLDPGCTANDVKITKMEINQATTPFSYCVGGETIIVDLKATLTFGPPKYDIGVFVANDGKGLRYKASGGGAQSCTVKALPTDFDPSQGSDGDTCGDSAASGSYFYYIYGVPVVCQARYNTTCTTGLDTSGNLFVPFATSWDGSGSRTCSNANDVLPNPSSKCNIPDTSVGTITVVILPKITKTDNRTTVSPGENTQYTVTITNNTGISLPLSMKCSNGRGSCCGASLGDSCNATDGTPGTCVAGDSLVFTDPAVTGLTVSNVTCSASTGGAICPGGVTVANMQGAGITITNMPSYGNRSIMGITQANPAVVTYSPDNLEPVTSLKDPYANGDRVIISDVVGMTEVNGREFTVANVNTTNNTFELSGVNSSSYTAYSSGGTILKTSSLTFTIDAAVDATNPQASFTNTARVTIGSATASASDTNGGSGSGSGGSRVRVIKWREVFR